MILSPVASFSQSFSPWELTATHFGPETDIFGRPQNANICYQTPKILILGLCMYCKHRIMYCRYKYMPQRYKLYVSKIQIISIKDTTSILQIHTLSMSETEISVYYIHRICII